MKNLVILIVSLLCANNTTQASDAVGSTYLKIKIDDQKEISYPPGTGFVAEDASGTTVLSPSRLEQIKEYKITEPITLWVFTAWNDEPDTYELSSGKLVLGTSRYDYDKESGFDFSRFKKRYNYSHKKEEEAYGAWKGTSNGVYITKRRFFDYDEATGYDTSLEFSNDVVFYYRDGEVEAWQDGKTLKIEGKYLIYTNLGVIKLSYNPVNKEIWYVFEKD